jgi:hypothetical protein
MLLPLLQNNLLSSAPVVPVDAQITVPLPSVKIRVMRPLWVNENPEDVLVANANPPISGSYQ